MGKQWTAQQLEAIDTTDKSLLVAAAAGSGKTAVLVERILKKITHADELISIDELLVVTFTNAAAAEMRERIGQALQEALKREPESKHLYQQSLLLNKAQITTLHSFCLELVRSHFFMLDISPSLKIMDEIEGKLLQQEVLEAIFEYYYTHDEKGQAFAQLVDQLGGREDEGVQRLVLRLYHQSMSMAQPKIWLEALPMTLLDTPWSALYWPFVLETLEKIQSAMGQALDQSEQGEGLNHYHEHLLREYKLLIDLQQAADMGWNQLMQCITAMGNIFERLPVLKKNTYDETAKEKVAWYRDKAKELYKQLQGMLGERTEQDIQQDHILLQPWVVLLSEVTTAFMTMYQQKKREKDLMDFDDMEHFCLALLYENDEAGRPIFTELSRRLKQQYHEVMVDEYQDINDLQESILQAVARENNLFMVGDIKQSIYGFRMANPQLFLTKYQRYPLENSPEEIKLRIDLNKNFRCREHIIEAVNDIFNRLMIGAAGDLLYDDKAALVAGAFYPEKPNIDSQQEMVEVLLLDTEEVASIEVESTEKKYSAIELEARSCAKRINEMFSQCEMVYDPHEGGYRALRCSDIVILMRSPKASGKNVAKQLEHCGLPVHVDSGDGYFDAWEIQIMLALLQILDNPRQDIPLVTVLHAPFFGFTEEELLEIRLTDRKSDFYYCITNMPAEAEDQLRHKVDAFLQQLKQWRDDAREKDTSLLIWQLYRQTGFYEYVGTLTGGHQRQANLRAFHDKARQYEQTSFNGLFMFLRFIEQMKRQDQDLEPAKILSENANVIRIMSIHKSKGLEFPVVFLLEIGKQFNFSDAQQDVVIDRQYGLGMPVILPEEHIKYTTIAQAFIKQKLRQEMLTEEKRVLYVALTRAREKLIMVGSAKKMTDKYAEADLRMTDQRAARSYLDWLLPIIKHHAQRNQWHLQLIQLEQLQMPSEELSMAHTNELQLIKNLERIAVDDSLYESINERFSWQYPDPLATQIRSKVTVTELKVLQQKKERPTPLNLGLTRRPVCMIEEQKLSAAEKGTLLHLVMRHIDLKQPINRDYLLQLTDRLEVEGFIHSREKEAIDLDMIEDFFNSELGRRMQLAETIYRELPFTVTIDSRRLEPEVSKETNPVLLQGIIDCVWWEKDGWVLVDYKSDRLQAADIPQFVNHYREQVRLYAQALEKIWRKPVKERYLYMFSLRKYVTIEE